MAMQKHLSLREWQHRPITALGYYPPRREFLLGFEDGGVQWCDLENGKILVSAMEHKGMVTHFLYWLPPKLLFSSSNDGTVVVWSSAANVVDRIQLRHPIFSIAINVQRQLLVCGFKGRLSVFPLDEKRVCGHVINTAKSSSDHSHTDIVSQITCQDHRIYTTGYDKRLLIFDTYVTREKKGLQLVHRNSRAHTAGITHLLLIRDHESTRLLTGSFDKTVGVWSQDAQLIHRLPPFTGIITGLCHVPAVGMVWIASANAHPTLYDPRAGETVSDFVDTFQGADEGLSLQRLLCPPEANHVIGTNKQHQVFVWKYNATGCVTILPGKHPIECLSHTAKMPLLLFSGHINGMVQKWEQSHLSPFLFSNDSANASDMRPKRCGQQISQIDQHSSVHSGELRLNVPGKRAGTPGKRANTPRKRSNTPVTSAAQQRMRQARRRGAVFTRSLFVEDLDILLMSAEDGDIYIWEFDDSITGSAPASVHNLHKNPEKIKKLEILEPRGSVLGAPPSEEEMSPELNKREAGLTCKKLLSGHSHAVSGLALVGKESGYDTVYLLSGGWDHRICLWDLRSCTLKGTFPNLDVESWSDVKEVVCEGSILDLAYSPERRLFAYSSSDGLVYIRRFGLVSTEMTLVGILQGHEADVTAVLWHSMHEEWVTGSEDGTIRIWDGNGSQCLKILNSQGAVTCLCIDQVNGCIIAGVQDVIRVYDAESCLQVQTNLGHKDCVQSVIHIPELKQYASASWDCTVRLWNAYSSPSLKAK
ncbi:uncharacterized protein [Ambystoma mexicanum]|uniref:uncharacterized protein n=1 Tax=Ambystoma mexicanum TaxID=8296 RepID=UPI0037E894ED